MFKKKIILNQSQSHYNMEAALDLTVSLLIITPLRVPQYLNTETERFSSNLFTNQISMTLNLNKDRISGS